MKENKERNSVTLCSYKDNNPLLWTPKAIIRMEINGKWEEYPVQWDEKYFFLRSEANKYALKKAKEWLSRNTQIKEKRIFTKEEWVIHNITLTIAWILIVSFGILTIFVLLISDI